MTGTWTYGGSKATQSGTALVENEYGTGYSADGEQTISIDESLTGAEPAGNRQFLTGYFTYTQYSKQCYGAPSYDYSQITSWDDNVKSLPTPALTYVCTKDNRFDEQYMAGRQLAVTRNREVSYSSEASVLGVAISGENTKGTTIGYTWKMDGDPNEATHELCGSDGFPGSASRTFAGP